MIKNKDTEEPKLEKEARRLLREVRLAIKKAAKFFFETPKNKDERMIHALEVLAWIALTTALILRVL